MKLRTGLWSAEWGTTRRLSRSTQCLAALLRKSTNSLPLVQNRHYFHRRLERQRPICLAVAQRDHQNVLLRPRKWVVTTQDKTSTETEEKKRGKKKQNNTVAQERVKQSWETLKFVIFCFDMTTTMTNIINESLIAFWTKYSFVNHSLSGTLLERNDNIPSRIILCA